MANTVNDQWSAWFPRGLSEHAPTKLIHVLLNQGLAHGAGPELRSKVYVYVWADGVYFNARLENARQCFLARIGPTADGRKELIALADGYRESEQSWQALLLDCQAR